MHNTKYQHISSSNIDHHMSNDVQKKNTTTYVETSKPDISKHIVPNKRELRASVIQFASRHHHCDSPRVSVVMDGFQEMEQEDGKLTEAGGRVCVLKNRWDRERDSAALNTGIVMGFTLEEEFKVIDYMVKLEDYHNMRFLFMNRTLGGGVGSRYTQIWLEHTLAIKQGKKFPSNPDIDKQLLALGLQFTKTNVTQSFSEMKNLTIDVRNLVLSSTYPAIYLLGFSILEASRKQGSWLAQMTQTIHFTKDMRGAMEQLVPDLDNLPAINMYGVKKFTWAQDRKQKYRFERTIEQVGELLKDDQRLQVLYNMLIMVTPSKKTSRIHIGEDSYLEKVQGSLCQLLYRYLATSTQGKEEEADRKTRLLLSLV